MKKILFALIMVSLILPFQGVSAVELVPDARGKTLTEGSLIARTSEPDYEFIYMFMNLTLQIDEQGKVTGWSEDNYSGVNWYGPTSTSNGTIKMNLGGEFDHGSKRFTGTFTSSHSNVMDNVIREDPYLSSHNESVTTYNGTFTGAQSETSGTVVLDFNGTYSSGGNWVTTAGNEGVMEGQSTPGWVRSVSFSDLTNQTGEIGGGLLRGTAQLSRDDGSTWLDLTKDQIVTVKTYDTITTGPDSRLIIKYADGSYFRMKSNSTVRFLHDGIQLIHGDSWFNLQKHGKQFKVVTPTTVCGVLGTEFSVSVAENGDTVVQLAEGMVSFEDEGLPVVIVPGEKFTFTSSGYTKDSFDYLAIQSTENTEAEADLALLDFSSVLPEIEAPSEKSGNTVMVIIVVVIVAMVVGVGVVVMKKKKTM